LETNVTDLLMMNYCLVSCVVAMFVSLFVCIVPRLTELGKQLTAMQEEAVSDIHVSVEQFRDHLDTTVNTLQESTAQLTNSFKSVVRRSDGVTVSLFVVSGGEVLLLVACVSL